ncbi:MAG: hypothetical protein GWN00_16835, partial [Aliifodinibius sp.]|nr:hypothetical protein [candidate division Zixibacteria bacterium]NIT57826.1 hypothetical protein [Fodinibius sp.]NIX56707.1 hypothetical protein [candidate division Zixibacteria bacterium]NIY26408.1 hypothetical protein [Fodinibius sp.]
MIKNKLKIHNKSVLGIIIILLWSSFLPSLYPTPIQQKKGIKSLAKKASEVPDWIKKESGYEGYTQQDHENMMMNELISSWFKGVLMILIGILSGFLIIRRGPLGHFLAVICFAFFLIIPRSISFIRYGLYSHIKMLQISLAKNYYSLFFSIIHDDIVLVISVIIFIYLILPSTIKKFTGINGI